MTVRPAPPQPAPQYPTLPSPAPVPEAGGASWPGAAGGGIAGGEQLAVPEPPADLVDAVAPLVAELLPVVAARIPATPAAILGRVAAPGRPLDQMRPQQVGGAGLDHLLAERLLGALELTVDELVVDVPAAVAAHVQDGVVRTGILASTSGGGESEASSAVSVLGSVAPGLRGLVTGLVGALVQDERVRPLLGVAPGTEQEVAAAHGRAHLAAAVSTAVVVLRGAQAPIVGSGAPVVVGVALDAALPVLRQALMPSAYAAALQERRRAEYVLPRMAHGSVPVQGHRFGLVEGSFPAVAGEPANGLVDVVPGGVVIRSGVESGALAVSLLVLADEPADVDMALWDEVVDVSYTAVDGAASVLGPDQPGAPQLLSQTPPWPGPVRVRVSARDRGDAREHFEVAVWRAPLAPEIVHKATDRLGHRLRGEPEPPARQRPGAGYLWIGESGLGMAATVTVVTGSRAEQVLAAFGADPARPVPLTELFNQIGIDPWVAVLPVEGAVLAVEYNGWQGAQGAVLTAASEHGRAASMHWNVNALTTLSFARRGTVLASFEPPPYTDPSDPEVAAALAGLELDDYHDRTEKGLAAVERFTGRGLHGEDVERLEAAGVGYRIR